MASKGATVHQLPSLWWLTLWRLPAPLAYGSRHPRHEETCDTSAVRLLPTVDCTPVIPHTWKTRVDGWELSSSLRRNQEWLWSWWSLFSFKGLFQTTMPLRNSVLAVAREMRRRQQGEGTVSAFDRLQPRAQWPEWRQRGPAWPPSPIPSVCVDDPVLVSCLEWLNYSPAMAAFWIFSFYLTCWLLRPMAAKTELLCVWYQGRSFTWWSITL